MEQKKKRKAIKKDTSIGFRIESEYKNKFFQKCEKNNVNVTDILIELICKYINS